MSRDAATNRSPLHLSLLDRRIVIDCSPEVARELLRRIYSKTLTDGVSSGDGILVSVREDRSGGFVVDSPEGATRVDHLAGLVWAVGSHVVVLLQRARPELLFLHAAALARKGRALLLLARSGGGKSTTTWGLLHHGFELLSDELAPIDNAGSVSSFPRALHLKRRPPCYPLPEEHLVTDPPFHVPLDAVATADPKRPVRPALLGFLEHRDEGAAPEIIPVGLAEATARIYASSLNPLAHSGQGVDACLALARVCPAFQIITGELHRSCEELRSIFDGLIADAPLSVG